MATKCLLKTLYKIYLFPHRSQKNWNLEGFHLNGDQVPFQNTQPICFVSTQAKKGKLKGFHLDGDQVSFQNTWPNLFVSTQATKKRKIERLSPEWRPSVFSKYSSNFIYLHKGHTRTEIWKAFTGIHWNILKYSTKDIHESTILVN